jgi:hypothetical protein
MMTSEVVLGIVAFRLAAVLLAGLILRALPDHPPAAVQARIIGTTTQGASIAKQVPRAPDDLDEILRDMLLHD